jgi:hypothetical protein
MRKFLDGAIVVSAFGFIAILALAAVFDHTIIWLHALQSLMYLAVIGLIWRGNRWGYFIAVAIAGLWNYINLFVTTFFMSGVHALQTTLATGHVTHPDQLIAVAAVAFHFVMVIASLIRILQTSRQAGPDFMRQAAAFVVFTGYFWLAIVFSQPRYLELFPRLDHPHGLFEPATAAR